MYAFILVIIVLEILIMHALYKLMIDTDILLLLGTCVSSKLMKR